MIQDQSQRNTERNPIVIAYLTCGGGHKAAAVALRRSILHREPEANVKVIDLCTTVCGPRISAIVGATYAALASSLAGLPHYVIYVLSNRYPDVVVSMMSAIFGRRLRRWLTDVQPALVVCTFPMIAAMISRQRQPTPKTINLITDAGRVSRLWLAGEPYLLLAPESESCCFATTQVADGSKVKLTGPVIDTAMVDRPSKALARHHLGIGFGIVIYLNSGALGFRRKLNRFVAELRRQDADVCVLVNEDVKIRDTYSRIAKKSFSELHQYGIAAADFVVGKAGWATMNEAAAIGRPLLIIDRIPGQERGNEAYALRHGGAKSLSPESAARYVTRISLDDPMNRPSWSAESTAAATHGSDNAALWVLSALPILKRVAA